MNKEQVIALLYDLSDEYIATNYERNANDVSYYLGLKAAQKVLEDICCII